METFPPIAIVGRACVLPDALSPEELWSLVEAGRDVVSAVPPGRWRVDSASVRCSADDEDTSDRAWTDRGGYVRGFERVWDPEGFAVPAAELAGLDPLFHWALHCARAALEDAGDRRRGQTARPRVTAVLGNLGFPTAEMSRYAESRWFAPTLGPDPAPVDPRNRFMSSGPARTLERALGLAQGAFSLDCACASSLYAIKFACDQLHDGRADLALAGAVNRADDLFLHIGFAALKALSRSGRSRPFHRGADGLLPAEGAGVVALKRLADARRDGDRVYGILRGVGLSNDGRGRGFLAPSEEGQRRAIAGAYASAGLEPSAVSLLECHATGTAVGDATELRSAAAIFAGCEDVPIGSLKSNMGHLITAAGVAGLIKVLEAMRHRRRPATLHLDNDDALLPELARGPFRALTRAEPWICPNGQPRIAGISAFGFGGNNAHVIVSEDDPAIEAAAPERRGDRRPIRLALVGLEVVAGGWAGLERFAAAVTGRDAAKLGRRVEQTTLALVGLRFPPRDLERALAQQRLALSVARSACAPLASLPRERAGVYMAMEPDPQVCRYGARWRLATRARESLAHAAPADDARDRWQRACRDALAPPLAAADVLGTMPNIPANRINSQLDLGGPSSTVSAGERSGRVALGLAARALAARELDAALVCAVDLSCQDVHAAALAACEGRDAAADPPGDAAVALVLRRIEDARSSGDAVLATIALDERDGDGVYTLDPADPADPLGLRARFGRCWAAGDLRELAAAVALCDAETGPDGQAWPGGRRRVGIANPGGPAITVERPRPAPSLHHYAARDEATLRVRLEDDIAGGEGPARVALLVRGDDPLARRRARARQHLESGAPLGPGVFVRRRPIAGELALVFAGAGAAYPGMGGALLQALPELDQAVRARSPALARAFDRAWPEDHEVPPLQRLWSSSYLSQVHAELTLRWLGLRPRAVIGYSSGESNSLFATGVWRDQDAMLEDAARSGIFTREIGGPRDAVARAWGEPAGDWETWTVLAPVTEVSARVAAEARAHLSIIHHDHECVVAGAPSACARIRAALPGARWIRLRYDLAVHVPELIQIRDPWLALHHRRVHAPTIPVRVYSGGRAAPYEPSERACAEAILEQATRTLDFRAVIERAYADGVRVFVEHGPQGSCSRWIRSILGPREAVIVALDRRGGGLDPLLETIAALTAAGVPLDPARALAACARHPAPLPTTPAPAPALTGPARPPRVLLPPLPAETSPMTSTQIMPPAPPLPPIAAPRYDRYDEPRGETSTPVTPASLTTTAPAETKPAPPPPIHAAAAADAPEHGALAVLHQQIAELGARQRAHVEQQAALHQQFLELRARSVDLLLSAARGQAHRPVIEPAPAPSVPQPPRQHEAPAERVSTPAPAPKPAPKVLPKPRPAPSPPRPARARASAETSDSAKASAPIGPTFDRAALEVHARGSIAEVFGPDFRAQDSYPRQVRMPTPPLLLADRVTGLDAEPNSMKLGTIWTETDVTTSAWYLHAGCMPAGIMIESGQADLMLISYLGVDRENRGERVYRLLGCVLTYHGGLPEVGETLVYDIHLDGHAKQGDTRLMFFHYDCHVGGARRLSVRQGQAGFFSDAELDSSDGCIWRPEDQEIVETPRLDPPALACARSSFTPAQVQAFAAGRPWECFGDAFLYTRSHTRTPRIQSGRMLFFDQVDSFAPRGGPWDRGYLRARKQLRDDEWFYEGHFHGDPCMPGTLMFEGCLQAMAFYLAALGYTARRDGWRFEPVPDEPYKLSCRGQVTPGARDLVYEVFIEEVIAGPVPTIYADLLCTVDGLKAFHARRVGLRLVPAWPLDEGHVLLERAPTPAAASATIARAGDFAFDYRSMLACACGRPTQAFGPIYARFDGAETVPRLPNPPYHFISRATRVEGGIGELRAGMQVWVELDVDPEAWYFAENSARTMPYCVLLEAALQPCGWLASYTGCALSVDEPLMFRNLDGTGTQHAEVGPDAGVLRTRARNTTLSRTASMIIVGFEVECRVGETLVYSLSTVFGFFPAAAFEDQAGLPTSAAQRAVLDSCSEAAVRFDNGGAGLGSGRPRVAAPMLRMLDRVVLWEPEGGAEGLGRARAEKAVDPGEWFFAAHFFQDPVQPGSLGIEAMIQLLQWCARELELGAGMQRPRFEPIALGQALTWKYRGQVVPSDGVITTTLEIVARGRDARGAYALATASLWIDGKRIYEATGLGVRVIDDASDRGRHGRRAPLSLDARPWLRDHRPTWTVPAVPMMSMVALLAGAARADERLVGLRDVRVKGWVTVPEGFVGALRCDRDGDHVRLFVETDDGRAEREVASARLRTGAPPTAPTAWPALEGPVAPRPYEDGSLFHGPRFQLLERLVRTAEGASSLLRLPDDEQPRAGLHPRLLDAATHGIPHDRLELWDARLSADQVAYPAWIPELDVFGPPPTRGPVRCEVRPRGVVGSVAFPAFDIQLIDADDRVWCQLRLVEACFPKGPLGRAAPRERRAFLRDLRHVPGVSLSRTGARETVLDAGAARASDWLPGTIEAVYGRGPEAPEDIARAEHIAAVHQLHPRALPEALPLTRFELEVTREQDEITVRGDPRGELDLDPLRAFWTPWFDRDPWPVEDLYYGLIARFVRRVVVTDPAAYAAIRGRSAVYLANHQVAIESLLFSIIASALGELPTVTLAKIEHRATWLGRLIEHCFSYPDVRDPGLIAFFDRADKAQLPRIVGQLAVEMQRPAGRGRSIMVHVEGTRSRSCAAPVEKMSGAFIDMALRVGAPVVPVRFTGGLPRAPLPERLEFPLGMGAQDIWIGRPLQPEQLARATYKQRKELVVAAINGLGPDNADERPHAPDPDFAAAVAEWRARHPRVDASHAVLATTLAQLPSPGAEVQRLLAAPDATALDGDVTPEGRWLRELAGWLLG